MTTALPPVFNFAAWVEKNAHLLRPPVNNKQMWEQTGDFIVQVIGGPNQRHDFHHDPYEEYFYQVKGDMHVNVMTDEGLHRVDIKEGDMWLLPRNVWHSPQRTEEGSIGIVVERIREQGTTEHFGWFCLECDTLVHEVEVQVNDIVVDMPPIFEAFHASIEQRTCPSCGALHPGKG